MNSPLCDPSNPDGIESVARIELPPGYSNLSSMCGGMQGWGADVKFEIDPEQLAIFLETTNIEYPISSTERPERPRNLFFRQGDVIHDSFLYGFSDRYEWYEEIIVDTHNPERWIVYFTVLAG